MTKSTKNVLIALAIILLLGAAGTAAYYYGRSTTGEDSKANSQTKKTNENNIDSVIKTTKVLEEESVDIDKLSLEQGNITLQASEQSDKQILIDLDDHIAKFIPNDSGTHLVYGIYESDVKNQADEKISEIYTWYLYDIKNEKTTRLSSKKFTTYTNKESYVNIVWGWDSDTDIVLGVDGIMAIGEGAIYNIDTEKITAIDENTFIEYLKTL